MMTAEEGPPTQEGNATPGAVPGAAGARGSGIGALGRHVARIGVGTLFLGLDQVHASFGHAVSRGEQVEAGAQRAAAGLRQRTADAARGATSSVSGRSAATWSAGLASVLNRLPGVSLACKPPQSRGRPVAEGDGPISIARVSINDNDPIDL